MFKLFQKNKPSNNIEQHIIVKSEIDYDKLADRIVKAMEKNASITEKTITNALKSYDSQKEKQDDNSSKSGSLFGMRILSFLAYIIATVFILWHFRNSIFHSFDITISIFALVVVLVTLAISSIQTKKKDEIERHFLLLTTLISLLLATLALFVTNDNSSTKDSNSEQTTISEECDTNQS